MRTSYEVRFLASYEAMNLIQSHTMQSSCHSPKSQGVGKEVPTGETGNSRWCGPNDIPPSLPARSQEPEARSQEPGARSQEPGAGSQEPGARSQEPGARSQEPGALTLLSRSCSSLPWQLSFPPSCLLTCRRRLVTCREAGGHLQEEVPHLALLHPDRVHLLLQADLGQPPA